MISVVITAYNRKEFLYNAINSLNSQDYRDFEVILVTNFDYNLNRFQSLAIKNIVMEGSQGLFLYTGIKEATGDIIVFLDDDTFSPEKLSYIAHLFSNENIGFIHNNPVFIEGERRYKKLYTPPDFNLSCMSIRKGNIEKYLEDLKSLRTGSDTFIYCTGLCSGKRAVKRRKFLTFYLKHGGSISELSKKWLTDDLDMAVYMQSIFHCKKALKYLQKIEYANKIKLYTFYDYRIEKKEISGKRLMIFQLWLYFIYNYFSMGKSIKRVLYQFFLFLKEFL